MDDDAFRSGAFVQSGVLIMNGWNDEQSNDERRMIGMTNEFLKNKINIR